MTFRLRTRRLSVRAAGGHLTCLGQFACRAARSSVEHATSRLSVVQSAGGANATIQQGHNTALAVPCREVLQRLESQRRIWSLKPLHRGNSQHRFVQCDRRRLDDQPAEPSRRSSWPARRRSPRPRDGSVAFAAPAIVVGVEPEDIPADDLDKACVKRPIPAPTNAVVVVRVRFKALELVRRMAPFLRLPCGRGRLPSRKRR